MKKRYRDLTEEETASCQLAETECAAWREADRLTEEMVSGAEARVFPKMQGRYVFKHAVTRSVESILEGTRPGGSRI